MSSSLVQGFLNVVPICPLSTPMYSILRLVGTDPSAQILVTDLEQRPLGIVVCHELLAGLALSEETEVRSPAIGQRFASQDIATPNQLVAVCSVLTHTAVLDQGGGSLTDTIAHRSFQHCLDAVAEVMGRSLLHPIICIPSHWSLQDFQSEFTARMVRPSVNRFNSTQSGPAQFGSVQSGSVQSGSTQLDASSMEWVVVDQNGAGMGLLNQQRVWQSLALAARQPPVLDTSVPDARDGDDLNHVFVQRLTEAQRRVQHFIDQQSDWLTQLQFKDTLLAYVSHEIKTPLTALVGLSELLTYALENQGAGSIGEKEQCKEAQSSERQRRYAHLIHHSSHQLMALMTILLDLIHIETGQLTLALQAISLESLCQAAYNQALEEYRLLDSAPDGVMHEVIPNPLTLDIAEALTHVVVDEHRFKRLLVSLFLNAIQLTDTNTPITLKATLRGSWIELQINHRGIGIPPEQQQHIFQRLALDGGPLLQFKGVGVRLMLALRLAEKHGGTLTWVSQEAAGMAVTVFLPCRDPHPAAVSTEKSKSDLGAGIAPTIDPAHSFVLIADDDPIGIAQVSEAFMMLGYGVAIARSEQEILDKIRCLCPVVIVVNPTLTDPAQVTVLQRLKHQDVTRHIPIIAITPVSPANPQVSPPSSQSRGDRPTGGVYPDAHLQLPLDLNTLSDILTRLLQTPHTSSRPTLASPITVLYLNPQLGISKSGLAPAFAPAFDLNSILHPHQCRVIEVDSVEQSELLTRVWHPDVIVFGAGLGIDPPRQNTLRQHPPRQNTSRQPQQNTSQQNTSQQMHPIASPALSFSAEQALTALKESDDLVCLPIVTLTAKATELAYRLGLRVFPCLEPLMVVPPSSQQDAPSFALLQVIQLAAASIAMDE